MVIKVTVKKSDIACLHNIPLLSRILQNLLVFKYELGFPYINCNAKSYLESFEYPDNTS